MENVTQLFIFHQNLTLKLLHYLILINNYEFFNYFDWKYRDCVVISRSQICMKFSDWFWISILTLDRSRKTFTSAQWKWWRHFKLQAKMLSEQIISGDLVYSLWLHTFTVQDLCVHQATSQDTLYSLLSIC